MTQAAEATPFGAVVWEMMRDRGLADASESGLEREVLRALRSHFEGERVIRRRMPPAVADALRATTDEKTWIALAWEQWDLGHLEKTALGTAPALR